jgi:hypothetical protein
MTEQELIDANKKFLVHKNRSKSKGIDFEFTFDEWLSMWIDSGHWHERGKCKGQYVMSRINDTGPYKIGNVYINTHANNIREAWLGRKRGPASDDHKLKNSLARIGIKRKQYAFSNE